MPTDQTTPPPESAPALSGEQVDRIIRKHQAVTTLLTMKDYCCECGQQWPCDASRLAPQLAATEARATDWQAQAGQDRERADDAEKHVCSLKAALETIRSECGAVCPEYEICTHASCASSYAAWAISSQALAPGTSAVACNGNCDPDNSMYDIACPVHGAKQMRQALSVAQQPEQPGRAAGQAGSGGGA